VNVPNRKIREIIGFVRKELANQGGKLYLIQQRNFADCDEPAYFDVSNSTPIIKVAVKGRDSFDYLTLVLHEYSHFLQWKEDSVVWNDTFLGIQDVYNIADLWIRREMELTPRTKKRIFEALANLEYDAELRTLSYIEKFGLGEYGDVPKYIREANAYILSYRMSMYARKWFSQCWKRRLVEDMPNKLVNKIYYEPAAAFYQYYPDEFLDTPVDDSVKFWQKVPFVPEVLK